MDGRCKGSESTTEILALGGGNKIRGHVASSPAILYIFGSSAGQNQDCTVDLLSHRTRAVTRLI